MCTTASTTASVLHGEKDLRIEQRDLGAPSSNDVQVAVKSTGLCGSDLHYYNHYRNGDILVQEPLTLGHESSGTVVAVGDAVSNLVPGDRVALEVGQPCEECEFCQSGRYNICRTMKFRSSAKAFPHAQGTLQERINHPAKWCYKLPEPVTNDLGALLEPLSVAMHAYDRAALPPTTTVLVFGAGAVGLLAAAVAKAHGAKTVVIADILKDRVDFAIANKFADAGVIVPMERPQTIEDKLAYARKVSESIKSTQVHGEALGEVGAVYECTGVETCVQTSIYSTKPGGKIMLIGMGTPILTLPISAAALREVDLVGVFRYANTYERAIKLVSNPPSGLPDLSKLITHRFQGLDKIPDAFKTAGQVKDADGNLVIKVFVEV